MSAAVVVSDTSPLHYLILIDAVHLLPLIADEIIVPPAVADELTRETTPEKVRVWFAHRPPWVRVAQPRETDATLGLDPGESEAISLAVELGIRSILIDERKGFRIARERGLRPIGLLAVLEFSAENRWIDFEDCVRRLHETNFRLTNRLLLNIRQRLKRTLS